MHFETSGTTIYYICFQISEKSSGKGLGTTLNLERKAERVKQGTIGGKTDGSKRICSVNGPYGATNRVFYSAFLSSQRSGSLVICFCLDDLFGLSCWSLYASRNCWQILLHLSTNCEILFQLSLLLISNHRQLWNYEFSDIWKVSSDNRLAHRKVSSYAVRRNTAIRTFRSIPQMGFELTIPEVAISILYILHSVA
jgi:hypothetical protein